MDMMLGEDDAQPCQASKAAIATVSWLRIIGYNAVSAWRQQLPRKDGKPTAWRARWRRSEMRSSSPRWSITARQSKASPDARPAGQPLRHCAQTTRTVVPAAADAHLRPSAPVRAVRRRWRSTLASRIGSALAPFTAQQSPL
jgi:hypothetical protein